MRRKTERFSETELLLSSILGKTIDEAKKIAGFSGFSIKVMREDDTKYIETKDRRQDRIIIEIDNKIITKNYIG